MQTKSYRNKTVLIIGGTGSIGSAILEELVDKGSKKIKIFSRDEYKQHRLRYKHANNKNIEYILGDIRDLEALNSACKGVDILFHCAALKHVPISEEMPEEFIKTNILGSLNIKKAALANKIPLVLSISTDKAANPSNVMGLTKAIQEKIFSSYSLQSEHSEVKFINVRFGNVIGTAGSFFPILYHQIRNKTPLTITNPQMTRFFMSKKEAIELIFWACENGSNGSTVLRRMKAARIEDIAKFFLSVLRIKQNFPINTIGVRVGEKQHEILVSEDEIVRIIENGKYFIVNPYEKNEISKNILKGSTLSRATNIGRFISSSAENRMSDQELEKYIKEYIKNEQEIKQYI